ncbi:uncharacterized protein LOC119112351 isoform X2 [Pollicipes pollicipes]|nr:uncharacterized protein LOC119112351 isoform X2 [Pollicipes pollicipes]
MLWASSDGHGRLLHPVCRASMWRIGKYHTPRDFTDNQLYCGGLTHQKRMGGKCGICGDPYDQRPPRAHEIGGAKFVKSAIIVEKYSKGAIINAKVQLTANHLGYFEFSICPVHGMAAEATQECLDRHRLQVVGTGSTRYPISGGMRMVIVPLQLPASVTCKHCVFQWKYTAGNNWGYCSKSGKHRRIGRIGCGPQEHFFGCADIAIF